MSRALMIAEMVVRDLVRRRAVLALLFLVPLAFYLARHESPGQAVRFASLGLGWGAGTAALFSANAAKSVEPRLRLTGYRTAELFVGRFAALLVIAWFVAAGYFCLILVDQNLTRPGAVAVQLVATATIAVPLGLVIGAAVPRDLEGTLLLIAVVGVQLVMDPQQSGAKLLPFWSTRELTTYAIDPVDAGYLRRGLIHGIATAVLLTAVTAGLTAARLRARRHVRLAASPLDGPGKAGRGP